jgi:hypothetical protein
VGGQGNFPEQIDKPNGKVEIFDLAMGNDIHEEPDELQKIEAFLEVLREEFNYLNLMLFHVYQDRFDAVFLMQEQATFIMQTQNTIY